MPGHNLIRLIIEGGEKIYDGFLCEVCHLLLRDAIQLSDDGKRLCFSCLSSEELRHQQGQTATVSSDYTSISSLAIATTASQNKAYNIDNFARKHIDKIKICCKYAEKGCQWIGFIPEFEQHLKYCEFEMSSISPHESFSSVNWDSVNGCSEKAAPCKYHHEEFDISQFEIEMDKQKLFSDKTDSPCPLQNEGCEHPQIMTETELHQHIGTSLVMHFLLMLTSVKGIKESIRKIFAALTSIRDKASSKIEKLTNVINQMESKVLQWTDYVKTQFQNIGTELHETKKVSLETRDELQAVIVDAGKRESEIAELQNKIFMQEIQMSEHFQAYSQIQAEYKVMKDKSEALRGSLYEIKLAHQKLSGLAPVLKLPAPVRPEPGSLDYVVSYDGTLLWKLSGVTRLRQEAILKKTPSVLSPPFYSDARGYKLCARLYFNGDGPAKEKYLSLFFAVMKGPYDALLQWPFKHKVTMSLLDQDHIKHHFESFKPDQTSISFKRPTKDINTASGSPFFFDLSALDTFAYLKDDTIFIKITVEEQ